MSSTLKRIQAVLKEQDVRDPRGTLKAIETLLAERKDNKSRTKVERGIKCLTLSVFVTETETALEFNTHVDYPSGVAESLSALRAASNSLRELTAKVQASALRELAAKVQAKAVTEQAARQQEVSRG